MPVKTSTSVRKSTSSPIFGDVQLVQGSNVTLTQSGQTITIAASSGAGNFGMETLDFGVFPGKSDASIDVTGQTGIANGNSVVNAWLFPQATADHTSDEHIVETLKIFAGNIVDDVGFTIYGVNTSQLNEPIETLQGANSTQQATATTIANKNAMPAKRGSLGGIGTRIYGTWSVAWQWA